MIVDATVLVAAVVDTGPDGAWAESIIAKGDLIAPELALVEATNILRRLELAGALTSSDSTAAQQDLMHLPIDIFPFEPVAERVWALRRNVTSYDALYVAIAEFLDLPLATIDVRLARATGPRCQFIVP
jgi:predicted nucleic acid-binding protein